MKSGIIKFFDQSKGFGFIKPDSGDKDIFFHHSGLAQPIAKHQAMQDLKNKTCTYETFEGKKGIEATNVAF